jgi:hypothetical protein
MGLGVISPHNDFVSAKVAHVSSTSYATDTAKWTLSATSEMAVSIPIPTGNAATDIANIQAAINAANVSAGTGIVQCQGGTYAAQGAGLPSIVLPPGVLLAGVGSSHPSGHPGTMFLGDGVTKTPVIVSGNDFMHHGGIFRRGCPEFRGTSVAAR